MCKCNKRKNHYCDDCKRLHACFIFSLIFGWSLSEKYMWIWNQSSDFCLIQRSGIRLFGDSPVSSTGRLIRHGMSGWGGWRKSPSIPLSAKGEKIKEKRGTRFLSHSVPSKWQWEWSKWQSGGGNDGGGKGKEEKPRMVPRGLSFNQYKYIFYFFFGGCLAMIMSFILS